MSALTLTAADTEHRAAFMRYAVEAAEPWHRHHLTGLYAHWQEYNTTYFDSKLSVPYLLFGYPGSARVMGLCSNYSGWGGKLAITIRYHLVDGNDKILRTGEQYTAGRARFMTDVLLHEMIHQYHFEITGKTEDSYKGHGPAFAAECNRIGALLGLPEVRPAKARGKHKALPSCANWPHNVRPADYYAGAYAHQANAGEAGVSEHDPEPHEPAPEEPCASVLTPREWAALTQATTEAPQSSLAVAALGKLAAAAGEQVPHR